MAGKNFLEEVGELVSKKSIALDNLDLEKLNNYKQRGLPVNFPEVAQKVLQPLNLKVNIKIPRELLFYTILRNLRLKRVDIVRSFEDLGRISGGTLKIEVDTEELQRAVKGHFAYFVKSKGKIFPMRIFWMKIGYDIGYHPLELYGGVAIAPEKVERDAQFLVFINYVISLCERALSGETEVVEDIKAFNNVLIKMLYKNVIREFFSSSYVDLINDASKLYEELTNKIIKQLDISGIIETLESMGIFKKGSLREEGIKNAIKEAISLALFLKKEEMEELKKLWMDKVKSKGYPYNFWLLEIMIAEKIREEKMLSSEEISKLSAKIALLANPLEVLAVYLRNKGWKEVIRIGQSTLEKAGNNPDAFYKILRKEITEKTQ